MNTSTTSSAPVESSDRLSFTVFLALALHALLILGVSFSLDKGNEQPPTLEITLASHKSQNSPDDADYLAQFNQEASGTEESAKELTTEHLADFADTQIRDINPTPQTLASTPSEQQKQQLITTRNDNSRKSALQLKQEAQTEKNKREGQQQEQTLVSAELASLRAKLDRQRQAYAKKPRIRRLTSVATKASFDAEYLHQWSSKVERIGNRNYPQEALSNKVHGDLRLLAIILPNGTIERVDILQSSGHRILDEAARQIVHMAAPFPPFPAEILKEYDQLEIIRTWRFEITGLSTSN